MKTITSTTGGGRFRMRMAPACPPDLLPAYRPRTRRRTNQGDNNSLLQAPSASGSTTTAVVAVAVAAPAAATAVTATATTPTRAAAPPQLPRCISPRALTTSSQITTTTLPRYSSLSPSNTQQVNLHSLSLSLSRGHARTTVSCAGEGAKLASISACLAFHDAHGHHRWCGRPHRGHRCGRSWCWCGGERDCWASG